MLLGHPKGPWGLFGLASGARPADPPPRHSHLLGLPLCLGPFADGLKTGLGLARGLLLVHNGLRVVLPDDAVRGLLHRARHAPGLMDVLRRHLRQGEGIIPEDTAKHEPRLCAGGVGA